MTLIQAIEIGACVFAFIAIFASFLEGSEPPWPDERYGLDKPRVDTDHARHGDYGKS